MSTLAVSKYTFSAFLTTPGFAVEPGDGGEGRAQVDAELEG